MPVKSKILPEVIAYHNPVYSASIGQIEWSELSEYEQLILAVLYFEDASLSPQKIYEKLAYLKMHTDLEYIDLILPKKPATTKTLVDGFVRFVLHVDNVRTAVGMYNKNNKEKIPSYQTIAGLIKNLCLVGLLSERIPTKRSIYGLSEKGRALLIAVSHEAR